MAPLQLNSVSRGASRCYQRSRGTVSDCLIPCSLPHLHMGSAAAAASPSKAAPCKPTRLTHAQAAWVLAAATTLQQRQQRQRMSVIMASEAGEGGAPGPSNEGPKAISLVRQFPGIGYTFVLAGFLKILTMASLTSSAPVGAVRTAFGQSSQFLLVPGGLLLCWIAKQVVDRDLQESPRFLPGLAAVMVFLYFFIYKLLYRYDIVAETVRRPQPLMSGPMARVRAGAGDRDRSGLILGDTRSYESSSNRPGQFNDLSYYEGRYPSQMQDMEREPAAASGRDGEEGGPRRSRVSGADLDARNPLRKVYRRAPGLGASVGERQGDMDEVMGPR